MKRAASLTIALLVCLSGVLYAINVESIDVKGGMIWIGNAPTDPANPNTAPSPLTTIVGAALPIRLASVFLVVPELRYFGAPYGIEDGRVVPVEEEFADWAWVMGLLVEAKLVLDFRVQQVLSLGAYVSPTVLVRLPARTWGDVDTGAITSYQYGNGHFFYPEVGLYLDWALPLHIESAQAVALNEDEFVDPDSSAWRPFHLIFDLNAYFPLFHAWDPEGLPSYDQLMLSGTIGLRFFLK